MEVASVKCMWDDLPLFVPPSVNLVAADMKRRMDDHASCAAFQARVLADFDRTHHAKPPDLQRRLLHIHLQHFLVLTGENVRRGGQHVPTVAPPHRPPRRVQAIARQPRQPRQPQRSILVNRKISWLAVWRAIVVVKICLMRVRCRKRPIRPTDAMEAPLPSTSVFVPIQDMLPVLNVMHKTEGLMKETVAAMVQPTSARIPTAEPREPPSYSDFRMDVAVLAARELFSGSSSSTLFLTVLVEAQVRLMHRSVEKAVLTTQRLPGVPSRNEQLHWERAGLTFNVNPVDTPDAQQVVNEWSVDVQLVQFPALGETTEGKVLGKLTIPLALLETAFARDYAMCRWFPLEKSTPGDTTRAEVRISVSFLMHDLETDSMIAYKPPLVQTNDKSTVPKTQQQHRRKPTATTKLGTKKTTQEDQTKQRPSLRKRMSDGSLPSKSSPKTDSAIRSPKAIATNTQASRLNGRRASTLSRVEAFSPPSSPSSSSGNDERIEPAKTPRASYTTTSSNSGGGGGSGRSRTSGRNEARPSIPRSNSFRRPRAVSAEEEPTSPTRPPSPEGGRRPFLKRKPYKVVFQRLDWSSVSSKTDSNLGQDKTARGSGGVSAGTKSKQPVGGRNGHWAGSDAVPNTQVSEQAIDDHVAVLVATVYAGCHVTKATARLASLKHKTERRAFVRGSKGDKGVIPSIATINEVHERIATDPTGKAYASRLQELLEVDVKGH